jgi:hypothetical protein
MINEAISEEREKIIGVRRFIMKPLLRKDLARVIREAVT